ncbi:hypothetical protein ACT3SZ_15130 [Corynebacterium sp. AOP40-9SA-29]|uniref:hypothetical protein n=1 Tax=Corynebacterium sp. AOP40-9SA-29 TaxID=3457677 RepID=UPI004033A291
MLIVSLLVFMMAYALPRSLFTRSIETTAAFGLVAIAAFLPLLLGAMTRSPIPAMSTGLTPDAELLIMLVTGGIFAEIAGRTVRRMRAQSRGLQTA